MIELGEIVRRARVDCGLPLAATAGHWRGGVKIGAAHLSDVDAAADVEVMLKVSDLFHSLDLAYLLSCARSIPEIV